MKTIRNALLGLALVGVGSVAMAASDTSTADQAVIRMSNAMGLSAAMDTQNPFDLLDALQAAGVVEATTADMMVDALLGAPFAGDALAIFVYDVLNGTEAAVTDPSLAREYLAAMGFWSDGFLADVPTMAHLDSLFVSPDFALVVQSVYQNPASPIEPLATSTD